MVSAMFVSLKADFYDILINYILKTDSKQEPPEYTHFRNWKHTIWIKHGFKTDYYRSISV